MPVTKDSTPKPVLRTRRCKYCRANFLPNRAQDKDAKFCSANHRKAYWRFGGLPFDKMKEQIMREVRKLVREELRAIADEQDAPSFYTPRKSDPAQSANR